MRVASPKLLRRVSRDRYVERLVCDAHDVHEHVLSLVDHLFHAQLFVDVLRV